MGSYIEEFQEEYDKSSEVVITVDGPSGAGKGTLAKSIAEKMDLNYYSAGDFFRKIAKENSMTVEELSEKADKETDIEVDRRTLEKALEEDCVIESRIASKVLGDFSDYSIYLTAELKERAGRVKEDLENRDNEEGGKTVEQVKEKIRKRDEDNRERYMDYYGIDMTDSEIHDIVVDNTDLNVQQQNSKVMEKLEKKFPERFD